MENVEISPRREKGGFGGKMEMLQPPTERGGFRWKMKMLQPPTEGGGLCVENGGAAAPD